jgi:hypothetical protein
MVEPGETDPVKIVLQPMFSERLWMFSSLLSPAAICMERAVANGFINNDIAVTDFYVVQARRVGANPGLVLNGSSLATEIRKRNQITFTTFATPGKCVFHEIASFLHFGGNMRLPQITRADEA